MLAKKSTKVRRTPYDSTGPWVHGFLCVRGSVVSHAPWSSPGSRQNACSRSNISGARHRALGPAEPRQEDSTQSTPESQLVGKLGTSQRNAAWEGMARKVGRWGRRGRMSPFYMAPLPPNQADRNSRLPYSRTTRGGDALHDCVGAGDEWCGKDAKEGRNIAFALRGLGGR